MDETGSADYEPDRFEEVRRDAGDCPVVALGRRPGKLYFLDQGGSFYEVAVGALRRTVRDLFGMRGDWLLKAFPDPDSKRGDAWLPSKAEDWLIHHAHEAGIFDPGNDRRGTGVWRGDEPGELIIHAGDAVRIGGKWRPAGFVHNGIVYAREKAAMRPAERAATAQDVADFHDVLGKWVWREPVHARLLYLGWLAQAFLVGVWPWRPHIYLSADAGSGKSTLDQLARDLFKGNVLGRSASTEASIRQWIGARAMPVIIDEIEADKPERAQAIIELSTVASREGQSSIGRGGADGVPMEFHVRASFYFTGVLPMELRPQDKTRITVLELDDLPKGEAVDGEPVAREVRDQVAHWSAQGPALFARMVASYGRALENLDAIQRALSAHGNSSRVSDQLGTLLAAGWTMLHDGVITQRAAAELVKPYQEMPEVVGDPQASDHHQWILYVMQSTIEVRRPEGGTRHDLIGELATQSRLDGPSGQASSWADAQLRRHGLGVEWWQEAEGQRPVPMLAVANIHRGLAELLRGSRWEKADRPIVLRRIAGWKKRKNQISFAGVAVRATLLPWSALPIDQPEPPPKPPSQPGGSPGGKVGGKP